GAGTSAPRPSARGPPARAQDGRARSGEALTCGRSHPPRRNTPPAAAVPPREDLPLERRMVGHARKRLEHAVDRIDREQSPQLWRLSRPEPEVERNTWQTKSRTTTSDR